MSDTRERVIKILVTYMAIDESSLVDDAKLVDDLGLDSLDLVDLEMSCEDAFDILMPDPSLFTIDMTLADAVRIIDKLREDI